MKDWKGIAKTVFLSLFPSARAYLNFWMMVIFLLILSLNRDPKIVLISAVGCCYFLNEWVKERRQNHWKRILVVMGREGENKLSALETRVEIARRLREKYPYAEIGFFIEGEHYVVEKGEMILDEKQ